MERKYPNASKELSWQYIFSSRKPAIDPRSEKLKQHYRHVSFLQKEVKNAIRKTQITKNASCHTFRHSFATHLLGQGVDIRYIQTLLGHESSKITDILYTHVSKKSLAKIKSPLDQILNNKL